MGVLCKQCVEVGRIGCGYGWRIDDQDIFVVCLGVLVLRITHPEIHRPFKTPAVFAVAPLGAASAVFLMFGLPGDTWLRLAVWLIVGLAIYFFYGRNHSHLTRRREGGVRL